LAIHCPQILKTSGRVMLKKGVGIKELTKAGRNGF
jgi:hypothetical protein